MSKVLVDRELLGQIQEKLDPHRDAVLWGEVCDAIRRAQPAEAEGVQVVGFLYKNNGQALTAADMDANTFALMARSDFNGEVEKLVRQSALQAVTAERDRLRSKWARVESERDRLRAEVEALRAMAQRANNLLRQIADSGYDDDSIDALTCWLEEHPGAKLFDRVSTMAAKEA